MSERLQTLFFKVIIPVSAIGFMMLFCYPECNKPDGFDLFLFWILVGFPFGIRRMCMLLIPKNYGIAGSLGVFALDCIIGGFIGGFVVIIMMIKVIIAVVQIVSGHICTGQ